MAHPLGALECQRPWGSPHQGRGIPRAPWPKKGLGKRAARPESGVEVVRHLPDAGSRAFAAPAKGAGARSTTTKGPKKVYTLEMRQGSNKSPQTPWEPKKVYTLEKRNSYTKLRYELFRGSVGPVGPARSGPRESPTRLGGRSRAGPAPDPGENENSGQRRLATLALYAVRGRVRQTLRRPICATKPTRPIFCR